MNPDSIIALLPKHSLDAPAVAVDGAKVSLSYSTATLARMSADVEAIRARYDITDASQVDIDRRDTRSRLIETYGARVDLILAPKPAKASAPSKGG